jgi:hypothetical protein
MGRPGEFHLPPKRDPATAIDLRQRAQNDGAQAELRKRFDSILAEMANALGRFAKDHQEWSMLVEDDRRKAAPTMVRPARRP